MFLQNRKVRILDMIGILLLVFNDCQLKMKTVSEISENYIKEAALHTKIEIPKTLMRHKKTHNNWSRYTRHYPTEFFYYIISLSKIWSDRNIDEFISFWIRFRICKIYTSALKQNQLILKGRLLELQKNNIHYNPEYCLKFYGSKKRGFSECRWIFRIFNDIN